MWRFSLEDMGTIRSIELERGTFFMAVEGGELVTFVFVGDLPAGGKGAVRLNGKLPFHLVKSENISNEVIVLPEAETGIRLNVPFQPKRLTLDHVALGMIFVHHKSGPFLTVAWQHEPESEKNFVSVSMDDWTPQQFVRTDVAIQEWSLSFNDIPHGESVFLEKRVHYDMQAT